MDEKETLMNRIRVCDFVLLETSLFLDTHPDNRMALEHYKKYQQLAKAAHEEYVKKYGPMTKGDYDGGDRWKWVDGPWPWERV